MSTKALADYTSYARYANYRKDLSRRESWGEQVDRVFDDMHEIKYNTLLDGMREEFNFAKQAVRKKKILGSQRALQFGGAPILAKEAKIYNCTASYVDRPKFFSECMYLLLCGCGTGFSVQRHHVDKLPEVAPRTKGKKTFVVPDTIEGWADAIGILLHSYFVSTDNYHVYDLESELDYAGYEVEFDLSVIRPRGAPVSWGGKAPGPEGLKRALTSIEKLMNKIVDSRGTTKLQPIEAYDIVMFSSDAVLSGGIRRSATICLFSPDDDAMATAKTGTWFIDNPQRGRSNNSALLIRGKTTPEEFSKLMESVKDFGEPGFVWADDTELLVNPCVEIGLRAYTEDGRSGWQFCNLCEINGKKSVSEEAFLDQCKAAAILGTLQAGYSDFNYLSKETSEIVKREALLGVSITGMMDNPEILFNEEIQQKGAKLILETNEKIAKIIGINVCARATCVKPAGSTSCILGSSSGIHPHHAKRYLRRVQANKLEFPAQHFAKINPIAVQESVWSNNNTDVVISFLCEVPPGAKTKNQMNAVSLLEHVKKTQQNWVEFGTRKEACIVPWIRHNVSNTITVKPDEWDDVEKYIYENRALFAGISLLPQSGELDYPQAPFVSVLDEKEIVQTYGQGSMFASGLIVDGLSSFNNNLWEACSTAVGYGISEELQTDIQKDWVRRFKQFAERYCNGELKRCSNMLKHVSVLKDWLDLSREYKEIDWSEVVEEVEYQLDVSSISGEACSGGKCELGDLGASMEAKKNEAV